MVTNRDETAHLLSLAVHEFRSPVTVVAGYVRMVLKLYGATLGDQPRKLLEEAEKSCGRLAGLIAELSDVSNAESGGVHIEQGDIDFFPLLAEVASGVHEGEDRNVRLEALPTHERAIVKGDRVRLAEALATVMLATVRERADEGVVVAKCGTDRRPEGSVAWMVLAPREVSAAGLAFRAADWGPFDLWRGGLGFKLVLASQVLSAHGATLYSGQGALARAACALTVPVKESSC
jgi:hypothetical protein